jgi:L-amino acid N-acyltransferase YncA
VASHIRMAVPDDAAAMLAIYTKVVRESAITFEYEPPSIAEFAARVRAVTARHPWLVHLSDGALDGYGYATTWRARTAYQWTVETTVYVREDAHRRGIGRALYRSLLACLRLQGYRLAIGAITLPNVASVGLHEACGFRLVGVHRACGHKLGRWHDVGFYEREIGSRDDVAPSPPDLPGALAGTSAWAAALASGLALG